MFTPTVFLPEVNSNEKNVALDDSKVHHLKNVLRVKAVSYTHLRAHET